ncbi:MAG TPA: hypothetical protein VH678_20480 [Xanthobacteraceae bacterium]|jgi:hypothetical protein
MLRASGGSGVSSFNSRTGAVIQTSGDVTTALGFTPLNPANNLADVNNAQAALNSLGGVVRSYISGLTLSNDGATPNSVLDIAAGQAADSGNTAMISIGAFTKSTAGAWAAGSGSNGMGNGLSVANSTWYHVILASNGGTPDIYFDTSATGANRPSGISDTKVRRIGSFLTDGSAHIVAFKQVGDTFYWSAIVQDLNNYTLAVNPGELKTFTIPTGVPVRMISRWGTTNGSLHAHILSPNETAVAVPTSVIGTNGSDLDGTTEPTLFTGTAALYSNTIGQYLIVGQATSSGVYEWTRGWVDDRGRFN